MSYHKISIANILVNIFVDMIHNHTAWERLYFPVLSLKRLPHIPRLFTWN